MGQAWKKNMKNLQGKPDIVGRDVWELGAADLDAAAGNTALTDRLSSARYVAGQPMRLEGAHLSLSSGVLTLGRVGVELQKDGVVVASGALYASGPSSEYLELLKGEGEEVAVASGSVLTANYAVESSLDTTQSLRCALSLAILEHAE